jgi:hypothetical protein
VGRVLPRHGGRGRPLNSVVSQQIGRMTSERTKADRESDIFRRFIEASYLPIDPASVEKRLPPEPDLLCMHRDEGPTVFELAELCDPKIAEFMATVREGGAYYLRTSDPSRAVVRKKLRRSYETEWPIELLLYTDGRIITPASVIIPTLRPYLSSWRNVFRRAWLFDHGKVHRLWERAESESESAG